MSLVEDKYKFLKSGIFEQQTLLWLQDLITAPVLVENYKGFTKEEVV